MMPQGPAGLKKAERPHLLLVEGKDEVCFFQELVKLDGLSHVQVIPVDGKSFEPELRYLQKDTDGFRQTIKGEAIRSIGVVRDADDDPNAARQSVCRALHSVGLSKNRERFEAMGDRPIVHLLILPPDQNEGALESLFLESKKDDPLMDCVDEFLTCVEKEWSDEGPAASGEQPSLSRARSDKIRMQAFLATKKDVPGLAESVCDRESRWDFGHPAFAEVRAFLKRFSGKGTIVK